MVLLLLLWDHHQHACVGVQEQQSQAGCVWVQHVAVGSTFWGLPGRAGH
jgi:hypothetical protein